MKKLSYTKLRNIEWVDVFGYEGLYQICELGILKSYNKKGCFKKYIYPIKSGRYMKVNLSRKQYFLHRLLYINFVNSSIIDTDLIVDHIDNNPLNNNLNNLQAITQRENVSKEIRGSSVYTGVSWFKGAKKWRAIIHINKKQKFLGYFENEIDAKNSYDKALVNFNFKGVLV
jgi:hypothetical protein